VSTQSLQEAHAKVKDLEDTLAIADREYTALRTTTENIMSVKKSS
jgi:hypothetical protein